MRYLAALIVSLCLASCSIVSSTPVLNDVLASKGDTRPFDTPLPVNTAHKKLAIGYTTTIGVKADGTVWSWGGELHGELGNGEEIYKAQYTPQPIQKMTDFIEVAGTGGHFLALRKDGTVWAWGNNEYGQLGYATTKNYSAVPQQVMGLKDIVSVSASSGHSLALDKQGAVWGFGNNESSQLGLSPADNLPHTIPIKTWTRDDAVRVLATSSTSAVLTANGELYYWGAEFFIKDKAQTPHIPRKYQFPLPIADAAMSDAIYVLATDGFVWAQANANYSGRLGQGDLKGYDVPVKVKNIGRIKSITAKTSSAIALDEKGRIWQWGESVRYPRMLSVRHNIELLPVLVDRFPNAMSVICKTANAVLLDNGEVYFWGREIGGGRGTGKVRGHEQSSSKDWSVPEKSLWTWK